VGAQQGRITEALGERSDRDEDALTLDGPQLVQFIKTRRSQGAGPSTAGNDLVWIGVVLRAAKTVDRKPVRPAIVDDAPEACRELRLIGKSRRRERRPTDSELEALDGHFLRRDKRSEIPMLDIWHFAITSGHGGYERYFRAADKNCRDLLRRRSRSGRGRSDSRRREWIPKLRTDPKSV
jgi:hypothetical protein